MSQSIKALLKALVRKNLFAFCALAVLSVSVQASAEKPADPDFWDLEPNSQAALTIEPVREDATSRDGLRLALKHYSHPGAQPVLFIHGLAQNDRGWDPTVRRYSFARFLHAQGFDVWVGNMRAAGTPGFRSETPSGAHHWTIDDYAISDVPGLIDAVRKATGRAPFVVGHSLAAWALEGYMAGLTRDSDGNVVANQAMGALRQHRIRGIISIAGVYSMRWEHAVAEAASNPIRDEVDYYHSNYELELVAGLRPLMRVIPNLPELPLGWLGNLLNLPLSRIPFVGSRLARLYQGLQFEVIQSPVLSMLYYAHDSDPELVRLHAKDGLEDLGPHLIEQLANAIHDDGRTSSYYHLKRPANAYDYGSVRTHVELPLLFVGGGRDRLASDFEIYENGYLQTEARDKQYLHVEGFGHLDICNGLHAPSSVMLPVARWMRERM